jgi:hypothetical protein
MDQMLVALGCPYSQHGQHGTRSCGWQARSPPGELLMRLGEALVHVQGEFQRGEGAGGFDEVAGVASQAGQHVVDHRRVRWAACRQVDGLLAIRTGLEGRDLATDHNVVPVPCPIGRGSAVIRGYARHSSSALT